MSNVRHIGAALGLVAFVSLGGLVASCQNDQAGPPENGHGVEQAQDVPLNETGDGAAPSGEGAPVDAGAVEGNDSASESDGAGSTDDPPPPDVGAQAPAYDLLPAASVSLDVAGLAADAELQCEERPEMPLDASTLPPIDGVPAHVRCVWGDGDAGDGLPPVDQTPQLLIVPIGPYMAAYAAHGLPAIEQQLALHTMLAIEQPDDPGVAVPMLPPSSGPGPAVAAHPRHMRVTGGSGLRYVGHDGPPPVVDDSGHGLFYTYQGLTSDGEYWVALFHPLSVGAALDASADELAALEADPEAYFAVVDEVLSGLDPDGGFSPGLTELDRVVESLAITGQ